MTRRPRRRSPNAIPLKPRTIITPVDGSGTGVIVMLYVEASVTESLAAAAVKVTPVNKLRK